MIKKITKNGKGSKMNVVLEDLEEVKNRKHLKRKIQKLKKD